MNISAILIFNCGSSSIKFALINPTTEQQYLKGLVERVGTDEASLTWSINDDKTTEQLNQCDYPKAIAKIFDIIHQHTQCDIKAVGHRVVHGGEAFSQSTLIDDDVIKAIEDNIQLAPLHNPANLAGIKAVKQKYPELPQVAVFDTAFHQTLQPKVYLYPIPYEYYQDYQIRVYGFHGISHRYVVEKAAQIINKPLAQCQFITAHLGNGASITASIGGKSVDTSMGFTPLAGLMMGTRSGDIDPGIHAYLCEKLNKNIDEITAILNKQSGLLGVSGVSMDMRSLHAAAKEGNERAQLAIDIFCYRLARMIGAMAVSLTHMDALIFTGGIGENDRYVREQVLTQLAILGFKVDNDANQQSGVKTQHRISTTQSTLALVIPTNEELLIAKDTARLCQ